MGRLDQGDIEMGFYSPVEEAVLSRGGSLQPVLPKRAVKPTRRIYLLQQGSNMLDPNSVSAEPTSYKLPLSSQRSVRSTQLIVELRISPAEQCTEAHKFVGFIDARRANLLDPFGVKTK